MPRWIGGGPLSINKRVAERLFLKTYDLELEQAPQPRIWAYRKAAWTADEYTGNIAELFSARREAGLRALPGIGAGIAAEIGKFLEEKQSANAG
jgi:DNA polymerase/3'-5' exonuclease PolX